MCGRLYKPESKLRSTTTWSAGSALHLSDSAFEYHEILHKSCNRYSKDALRQGRKWLS